MSLYIRHTPYKPDILRRSQNQNRSHGPEKPVLPCSSARLPVLAYVSIASAAERAHPSIHVYKTVANLFRLTLVRMPNRTSSGQSGSTTSLPACPCDRDSQSPCPVEVDNCRRVDSRMVRLAVADARGCERRSTRRLKVRTQVTVLREQQPRPSDGCLGGT